MVEVLVAFSMWSKIGVCVLLCLMYVKSLLVPALAFSPYDEQDGGCSDNVAFGSMEFLLFLYNNTL